MFNLPEVRAEGGVLFRDWLPQIFFSEHQSGITSPRQFVSPYGDPFLPDVNSLVWTGIEIMGANMRYDLDAAGKTGITHQAGYTGWWTGAEDEVSWTHNIVALLTEAAAARIATPIYLSRNELPEALTTPGVTTPHPWLGGWWRLQDIVDNEVILNLSAIRTAHERKTDFLMNFYKMNKQGIEAPGGEGGFVISAKRHDPLTAIKMVNILRMGGLEVSQAEDAFVAGGKSYPAGSFIVPLAQPYRAHAITLLDRQRYPDVRQYADGPPIPPYDNAGWTLPFLMGVTTDRIGEPITVRTRPLEEAVYPTGGMPSGHPAYVVLDTSLNASYAVAAGVLAHGGAVSRTLAPVTVGQKTFVPGAFVIKGDGEGQTMLPALLAKWQVTPEALESTQGLKLGALKAPRIGVYQSYLNNMDEGWTRYALDPTEPLGFGMPAESAAMFNGSARQAGSSSLAMDIFDSGQVNVESRIAATYRGENELLSGWMIGGERMEGKAAVVDVKDGKGRVAMIGFRPLFRAQSHGTYKLFLNALYYPEAAGAKSGAD